MAGYTHQIALFKIRDTCLYQQKSPALLKLEKSRLLFWQFDRNFFFSALSGFAFYQVFKNHFLHIQLSFAQFQIQCHR